MQRSVSSTVVAVVGAPWRPDRLGAPNVRVLDVPVEGDALARAIAAWSQVGGSHRPYLVHDADPLAAVADAWVALVDGVGARGELEVAAGAVRGAWSRRQVELPDYYLVVDADAMPASRRHWYLGVLVEAAPHRVVPVEPSVGAVLNAIRHLPPGRWWPDLDRLLDDALAASPDRFRAAADDDASGPGLVR